MKPKTYIIGLYILLSLIIYSGTTFINTRKSQEENKKRKKKRIYNDYHNNNNKSKIRRRLDGDDDDVEATSLVYNRCDHGHTPDDIDDCTKYSTDESSCCIFTYGQDTGCVLIGFKYLGSKSVGDMTVNCNNKYITFNFLLIIMLCFLL